jgi:hypothetical protein
MWAQLSSAGVGIGLMAMPSAFGYGRPMATSDWIVGPLITSFALVAAWECTRAVRWVNLATAVWLLVSSFVFDAALTVAAIHLGCGMLIGLLSLVRGPSRHSFGGGWRSLTKLVRR